MGSSRGHGNELSGTDPVIEVRYKLRVLYSLRTCFEGYSGIPQVARLEFSCLAKLNSLELTGLLLANESRLSGYRPRRIRSPKMSERIKSQADYIVLREYMPDLSTAPFPRVAKAVYKLRRIFTSVGKILSFRKNRLFPFDSIAFQDYIWERLFSKTLSATDYDSIITQRFLTIALGWNDMDRAGLLGFHYPRLHTDSHDVFVAHNPFPGTVSRGTQLLIRFHDAIPITHPHVISGDPYRHLNGYYCALRANSRRAFFVCSSEASRRSLTLLFPELEERSEVIPPIVAPVYHGASGGDFDLERIVLKHLAVYALGFRGLRDRYQFEHNLRRKLNRRYLLAVSTLEPRKNYKTLISGWYRYNATSKQPVTLVIVASQGWRNDDVLQRMRPHQLDGSLVHLEQVPASELRQLYQNADAVICPSVAEGFDLSGAEAIKCGAPVVASDIAVHREAYEDAALYFNTWRPDDLADKIGFLCKDGNRDDLIRRGRQVADRYTASNVTTKWETLLERLARQRPAGGRVRRPTEGG